MQVQVPRFPCKVCLCFPCTPECDDDELTDTGVRMVALHRVAGLQIRVLSSPAMPDGIGAFMHDDGGDVVWVLNMGTEDSDG